MIKERTLLIKGKNAEHLTTNINLARKSYNIFATQIYPPKTDGYYWYCFAHYREVTQ